MASPPAKVTDFGVDPVDDSNAITHCNPIRLIAAVSDEKNAFYRKLPKFHRFGKGWLKRVKDVERICSKMAVA